MEALAAEAGLPEVTAAARDRRETTAAMEAVRTHRRVEAVEQVRQEQMAVPAAAEMVVPGQPTASAVHL